MTILNHLLCGIILALCILFRAFAEWLRSVCDLRSASNRSHRIRRQKLDLEVLEWRIVLNNYLWLGGGAGGLWSDQGNWWDFTIGNKANQAPGMTQNRADNVEFDPQKNAGNGNKGGNAACNVDVAMVERFRNLSSRTTRIRSPSMLTSS